MLACRPQIGLKLVPLEFSTAAGTVKLALVLDNTMRGAEKLAPVPDRTVNVPPGAAAGTLRGCRTDVSRVARSLMPTR
jgi:hypothetical protein